MILKQVTFDEREHRPHIDEVTVTMTRSEAVALVNIAGQLNGHAESKLRLTDGDSLYDCLDSLFCRHEDESPDLGIDLATINSKEES